METACKAVRLKSFAIPAARTYRSKNSDAVCVARRLGMAKFVLAAVLCALAVPFLVMNAVRENSALAEWWVINVQNMYVRVVGTLTSWLPVSVLELFVVTLIGGGLYLFARLFVNLCRARFSRVLTGLLAIGVGVMYVLDLYMMSMGFGYYRTAMPLPSAGEDYKTEQTVAAVRYFLDDYNRLAKTLPRDKDGLVIRPYSVRTLSEKLKAEFARIDNGYLSDYTPNVKPIVNSWFLSDVLITGITFLPVGEANVNVAAPPTSVTFTAAHELAHTKGIQREGDANLIAEYVLLSSSDDYLRYCGYYEAFSDLAYAVALAGDKQEYLNIIAEVDPLVYAERRYAAQYWASQPDIMGKIGEFFNNLYLQSNGVSNGTGSYDDGNKTDVITPINPDTGKPEEDPDTGKPIVIPVYSQLQRLCFYLYENTQKQ